MSEEKRLVIVLVTCFCHDTKGYSIDFKPQRVYMEQIDLEVSAQSLCAVGSREDAEFAGCWALAHEVDETPAEAKYENGLLQVRIPLKKPVEGTKVKVK